MKNLLYILLFAPLTLIGQTKDLPKTNSATINGWVNVDISVDSFLNANSFEIFSGDTSISIVSFQLVLDSKHEVAYAARRNGNTCSQDQIARLRTLKSGDRVIVDMIRGQSSTGPRTLPPIVYTLTE